MTFKVGDRVFRRLNGEVFFGTVGSVFEDLVMVLWDSGDYSLLDEATAASNIELVAKMDIIPAGWFMLA